MHRSTRVKEIKTKAAEQGVGIRIRGRESGLRYDLFLCPHWYTYALGLMEMDTCPLMRTVVRWPVEYRPR